MPNGEGYPDPTADIAIARVYKEQMMKKKQKKGGKESGEHTKTEKSNKNR